MAYDPGLAELMRDDLADISGISEKKMFGGIAFMLHGHMVCGVHQGGGMFRIGKDAEAEALAIEGAGPMMFTDKRMGGLIDVSDDALADDDRCAAWMAMALAHARSLPPKA
jgi:TfoX/Sxy family transcriptional regulator of competence genes